MCGPKKVRPADFPPPGGHLQNFFFFSRFTVRSICLLFFTAVSSRTLGDSLRIDIRSGFAFWAAALVCATTRWGWGWICCGDPADWPKLLGCPTAAAAESPSWTPPVGPRRTESLRTRASFKTREDIEGIAGVAGDLAYLAGSSPRWPCSRASCEPRLARPPGGAAWCRSPGRWSPRAPRLRAWWRDAPSGWAGAAGGGRRPSRVMKLLEDKVLALKM